MMELLPGCRIAQHISGRNIRASMMMTDMYFFLDFFYLSLVSGKAPRGGRLP